MMDTPMSLMNERVSELCSIMACVKQELSEIKANQAAMRTDVAWLKKFFWLPVGATCTALAGAAVVLLFR